MLTISKPLSSSQAQTYHAKEFTSVEQNYWRQDETTRSAWHGRLAEAFGLSGTVGTAEFARLTEGQHPATGEQLILRRTVHAFKAGDRGTVSSVEHRAAWDATFSAPKSVSLTALVGRDEAVREAHRRAVSYALTELECYAQARIGGNHGPETTGQLVAATFEHDTARPVDGYAAPQLHTHAVIFNMTRREDGTMRALQPRSLFETQRFATAVYQSQLTYQLRSLGYEITSGRSGAPEIKGYTQAYLDASSPRRQQIVEAVAHSGFSGPEAAQIAAHNTRDRKQILSPSQILAAHRHLAAEHGNQAESIVSLARSRRLKPDPIDSPEARLRRANSAVSFARDKGFEREAVLGERALLVDALRKGMGELTYSEVRNAFEARVASAEFRKSDSPKHSSERYFTIPRSIQAEREILQFIEKGHGADSGLLSAQEAISFTDSQKHLNFPQRRAIEQILTSADRIQGLQGSAGSGKTTSLLTLRLVAEQNGYAVEGFAPTSRAAQQLRAAGISADTLQRFLARTRTLEDPDHKHFYMVDESSLASTEQMRDFLGRIGKRDKVLLIGDIRQHQSVDAGKPFEQLQQAGMRTAVLDRIARQRNPELLRAVEHLSKNETAAGVQILERRGYVTEIRDEGERIAAIARAFAANPENTIIVSPDNAARRALNLAVRQQLQARGMIDTRDHTFAVLAPRSEMTGAERAWAARYETGDVLHYIRGSRQHGIKAQSYARVVAANSADNRLTVELRDGRRVSYDPSRVRGISAYREIERDFAVGDRVQLTAPNRSLQIANRELGTLKNLDRSGRLTLRMDSGREVSFDPRQWPHFDHGYAVTSHSSQGLTSERVLINVDTDLHPNLINSRFAYVSVSRAARDVHIFANDASKLAASLSRVVSKSSAIPLKGEQNRRSVTPPSHQLPTESVELMPQA